MQYSVIINQEMSVLNEILIIPLSEFYSTIHIVGLDIRLK